MSHPAGLHMKLLREVSDNPTLRDQWNDLAEQMRRPQVFFTYEWSRAVQLAYGQPLRPLLLLAYDESERLVGVAALAAPEHGAVSFLCATTGDYCDFVVAERNAAVFVAQVFQTLRQQGYRDIVLTNLPEDSPSYAALHQVVRANQFRVHTRTAYECAQVRLSMAHADGKLALPRQKMVRRSIKVMSASAPLTAVHQSAWHDVGSHLPEFFLAHVARFLFTDRLSNMLRPERRRFLSELAQLLSPTGWLCLTRLEVGARTVAWNFGFTFRGSWFLYQPTFVNDLEKYSPGFVLLYKMVEEAARNPALETVDLGLGAEAYKESFANDSRRTMYVTLHRSRLKHWREIARYRAAHAIRARPRAERALRTLLAGANALRSRMRQTGARSTCWWILKCIGSYFFSREEVVFFETAAAPCTSAQEFSQAEFSLCPASYELLAEAAMQCCDDEPALQYLLRCARRLRQQKAEGFALVEAEGKPVQFAWASPLQGFFCEEWKVGVPAAASPNAVVLFDGWAPADARGRGYYSRAARLIADSMGKAGKQTWMFCAAADSAALLEIERAGFQRRYSLVRQRIFGREVMKRQAPLAQETRAEVTTFS